MTNPVFKASIIARGSEGLPSSIQRIEPTLKNGGFAKLLRAIADDGCYAVKSYENAGYEDAEAEYRRLEALRGCGCVPDVHCLGWVTYDGISHPAIIEDYIVGRTLEDVINLGLLSGKPCAPLSDIDTATIMLGNARALETLGSFGIVHRDFSLGNSILTAECINERIARGARVKLIDLGQSTFVTAEITPSGRGRLATIAVAAPEVYGGIHYDQRNACSVDAYSLALTTVALRIGSYWWPESLAELKARLEHRHNLRGEDCANIVAAKTTPVDLCEIMRSRGVPISSVDKSVADIVRDLTAFDPSLRPPMSDVIVRLERIVRDAGRYVTVHAYHGNRIISSVACETPLVPRSNSSSSTATAAQHHELPGDSPDLRQHEVFTPDDATSALSYRTLERLVEHNDATACRILGIRYMNGDGIPVDIDKGIALLDRAADAGDADAAYWIGRSHWDGLGGMPVNPLEAIRHFEQAAGKHHPEACYRLGWCYEHGMCGAQDAVRASLLYQDASRDGHGPATRRLAMLLWEGRGVPQDTTAAARMFRKGSQIGDVPSTRSLGWCYECGIGVQRDTEEAARLYEDAASKGDESAARLLEHLRGNS